MADYDVIIVGGGIGGTAIGAILASKGLKALIIEKNRFIGGRCSTYEKEGFKIDLGVHLFGRTNRGPHGKILKMLGLEDSIEFVVAGDGELRWYHDGVFWKFPSEFQKLLPPAGATAIFKIFGDALGIKDTNKFDNLSVKSWITKFTTNPIILSFISTMCGLYFGVPYQKASTGEFLRCLTSQMKDMSTGYPKGGCISIPLAYAKGMEKFGGKINLGLGVKKIVIENSQSQGVYLSNDEFISSKLVISNAGIKETVNDLVGRKYFDNDYVERINNLNYSISALTLKVALKKAITPFKMVCSISAEDHEANSSAITEGHVPEKVDLFIPIPSNFDPNLAPKGKQLLIAGTGVPKENFEKNKPKWIEGIKKSLENIFPGFSENVMWYDVTTPKDIEYLAGKEAAMIGVSQEVGQTGENRPSTTLPIEGLYLVGGDAGGWGIGTELAAKSAIECSKIILNERTN